MLAYGVVYDLVDEYMRMRESTSIDSMYKFCRAVIEVFGSVYSREPNMEATSAGVGDFVRNTFILVVLKMKYYVIHFKIYEYM
jgi:hypothetical protein